MVAEAFSSYDQLQQSMNENPTPLEGDPSKIAPSDMEILGDQSQHETLLAKASTPLYESSSTSILATILLLLNLKTLHGVSSVFMDEFFFFSEKGIATKREQNANNCV
jgi:hypothetical protein